MEPTPSTPSRTILRILPAVAWAGVIFAGSSIPGSRIPGRFGNAAHFVEYAVFGALVLLAMARPGRLYDRSMWIALAICALYAFSDEFHQAFVPLRTPDPLDWTLDVMGSSVGIAAWVAGSARAATRRPSKR